MFRTIARTFASARCPMASRRTLRHTALLSLLTMAVMSAFAANALAVSGTPINVGTPFESGPPAVAVDSAGTAYIAWANTKDLPPATTDLVQYCVLPAGAKGCSHTGTLAPADSGTNIDGVQVLVDGSTLILLPDVYGTAGSNAGDYIPEQEWESTDGGATFSSVNGGLSVADGILSADTGPVSAVVVPGTNVLGYGWISAASFVPNVGAAPTFDAFPLSSPAECSTVMCPAYELYSVLEPDTNADQVANLGGQYASQTGANPGVMGIFDTDFSNGPLGCPAGEGTAYAYGSGVQSAVNDYDSTSAAGAGSAWKVLTAQADCNVDYPAVGGGPSGFGVLEHSTANNDIVYHRFDQAHENFDTPPVTIAGNASEEDSAVSQDGAGGVYGTFLLGGGGGPISLVYSSNAGASWTGPTTLNPDTDGGASDVTSAVGPTGQGWATWTDNGSIFAQQFDAKDAIAASIGSEGSSSGTSVTITVTCASTPCTVTITITIDPVVTANATRASTDSKRTRHKTITLATGTFTIHRKGLDKLAVKLTKTGKKYFATHHGHVKGAGVLLGVKTSSGVEKVTRTITIAIHKKR